MTNDRVKEIVRLCDRGRACWHCGSRLRRKKDGPPAMCRRCKWWPITVETSFKYWTWLRKAKRRDVARELVRITDFQVPFGTATPSEHNNFGKDSQS